MPGSSLTTQQLFGQLYGLHTEEQVDDFIAANPGIFKAANWFLLGGHENNYGVIENQQASPYGALVFYKTCF
ncbi:MULTISPECIES: hypothetical protein [Pseudomonadati]|uniref:Uncharacterized protein n=1 Tax=Arcticibacter tournemirensis TaxID=699437 RepID=A0A4Q0MA31_9SPHI|nr:hypothetical protein [Arcticibacter tournemirensis]RXF70090.1 hypothetical protein EKH83_09395 [Arcticibacter tournemirensis]